MTMLFFLHYTKQHLVLILLIFLFFSKVNVGSPPAQLLGSDFSLHICYTKSIGKNNRTVKTTTTICCFVLM